MPQIALDHVQIAIPPASEDEARRFYSEVLQLEEMTKPQALQSSGGVWYRLATGELHLGVEADFRPARKAHPALRVADIDEFAARCAAAAIDPTWDDRIPGVRRFYVADPFGNRIEILQAG